MPSAPLTDKTQIRVLQVSPRDIWSGAERVAWLLYSGFKARGIQSSMAVGIKASNNPDVTVVPNRECYDGMRRIAWSLQQLLVKHGNTIRGAWRLSRIARALVEFGSIRESYNGHEDYRYPGIWRLLRDAEAFDVIHLHNLHGGYFDLKALPSLSHKVPVVVTLHDLWIFTGFCFYPFGCERWRTGCGQCPLLHTRPSIVPAILRKDGTQHNWNEKREIYSQSRLFIACPSKWLMDKVNQSILAESIIGQKVIPYSIDLSVFRPGDRKAAKESLGISENTHVVVTVGTEIIKNTVKGFAVIRDAMIRLGAKRTGTAPLLLLVVGSRAQDEKSDGLEIRFIPYAGNASEVSRFYQAADVYIHGAKEDNFPNTVLEALACGTPVVSTAAGGIPEQVKPFLAPGISSHGIPGDIRYCGDKEATGILVPVDDSLGMAVAMEWILANDEIRRLMGINAAKDALERFDPERQLNDYQEVYESVIRKKAVEEHFHQ
jgi:glycosyltransferase involved in cell wall biosynthesis